MKIGNFEFDKNGRTFIIAELSANHNQDLSTAIRTVRAAKQAGADAIKLQTYTPDTLTIDCDNEYFHINQNSLWNGQTLYQLYKQAYTPWEWHTVLQKVAMEEELEFFSSPFDKSAVDFLETMNIPAYKIASFEIQEVQLIKYVASKMKPIIISTGIAEEEDINLAVETCRLEGNNQIFLLKCTSSYPAPIELANLKTIPDMRNRFGVEVGLSDHTFGTVVPITAVALGARIIEKHFILDKSLGGPDADFSLDVGEFGEMVKKIRETELALGEVDYNISEKVKPSRKFARSLFVVEDVKHGDIVSEINVRSIRPGYGLHPKYWDAIVGKVFLSEVKRGTPLKPDMIEGFKEITEDL